MYIILMKKINWLLALEQYKIPVCTVWPVCDHVTPFHFTQGNRDNCSSQVILAPLFGAGSFGNIMLERAPNVRGLTLADSVPSLHCGLPADFLNYSCAIDCANLLFSFCRHFALQAAFLALLYRKRKKTGFIAHFKLLYLYLLGMVRLWTRQPEPQVCC